MASSIRDLKKSREAMFAELNKQVEQDNKKGGGRPDADPRFWYPAVDPAGNGFAIIRFLPAPVNESIPYIREFAHGFKGPGGWYIQRSRTTLRGADGKFESDPVSEYNREEWKRMEELKAEGRTEQAAQVEKQVKSRKRNVSYISNVLVLKDSLNPENEGKVFLFRYGKKIFDKVEAKMKPAFEGDTVVNVFDFWEGANLRLKITTNAPMPGQKKGFRNYDNSEFDSPSPVLGGDDDKLEALWKKEHSLQALIAPETFLSYEELEKQLNRAMKIGANAPVREAQQVAEEPSFESSAPKFNSKPATSTAPWEDEGGPAASGSDPEDDLEYYRNLAKQVEG